MEESKQMEYTIEPGQEWHVDFFRPEDAEGVARLFLSVYGKEYPIKTYIQPELLIEENAAGRVISSVARTAKGEIVGHWSLYCSAPYRGLRECGAGLVHASYRARGVNEEIGRHSLYVAAPKSGVEAVFGEAVCNHVFEQKIVNRTGFEFQSLEVDLMPASAYDKEKSAMGRVAAICAFRTYRPKPHRVFVPPAYEEALAYLYSGLDDKREILKAGERPPSYSSTRMESSYFQFAQVARLHYWEPGKDFAEAFEREEKKCLENGAMVLQVFLNLGFPWVDDAVEILRKKGYFLGGLFPRWFDGDGLLMQKIMGRPCWEGIMIATERGKRILDLVKQDWARTS